MLFETTHATCGSRISASKRNDGGFRKGGAGNRAAKVRSVHMRLGDAMAKELVRYDAMCRAIAAAYKMDEVKDIRDKALALATADYGEPKKSDGQQ